MQYIWAESIRHHVLEESGGATQQKQIESPRTGVCFTGADTCIVLYQVLHSVKLRPRGDVVAAVVKFADLIMFDVVSFVVVPVAYRQRVST